MQKHILYFSLVLLSFSQVSAQVGYQHYLDSSVRWTYEFSAGGPGAYYYNFTEYSVQGDTLIGNTWYWNIWARTRATLNGVPSESYQPIFGMRETPDKKFYQYTYNAQSESLMNDFNLKLGDTLQHNGISTFFVDAIDTISFGSEQRLLYKSIYPCGVIEGIGFIARDGSFNNRMVCFNKQQNFYPSSSSSCGFSASEEVDNKLIVRYWPNPAEAVINLELPSAFQQKQLNYRWYTLAGQLKEAGVLQDNAPEISLAVEHHPPGMYMLMLGNDRQWTTVRVMIAP